MDTPILADPEITDLSQRFAAHAAIYAGATPENASPLYAHLCPHIAADLPVLDLVRHADRATQVSNLLFGAVQYLLLKQPAQPLARFYASLTARPAAPDSAYEDFRAFCLEHADAIRTLVTTRRVQTNEVGRCASLLPAFALVDQQVASRPLALVEVGASAGLNLRWNRYSYSYDQLGRVGDVLSPVQLHCTIEGTLRPPLPTHLPTLAARVGIDLHPVDVHDANAVCWLQALVWPEQRARAALLEQALAEARTDPPAVVAGDAAELLPSIIAALPSEAFGVVFHSYTLNQCPPPVREAIEAQCLALAQQRPLARVALEWYGGQPAPELSLIMYDEGRENHTLLARCESHGRSITWLDAASAASESQALHDA